MGIEEFLLDQAKREGREEGKEEGREEAREENTRDIALKMKNSGLDISLIANITGLSVKEIQNL